MKTTSEGESNLRDGGKLDENGKGKGALYVESKSTKMKGGKK